jgi:hypothetical protein
MDVAPIVLKRSSGVLEGVWTKETPPRLLGRLKDGATMADAGAAALVFSATTPPDAQWGILPFGAFANGKPAPIVTERTEWRATENGHAVPCSLQTVPPARLHDWKGEIRRAHPPSDSDD